MFEGDGVVSDFPGNYTLYRYYQQQQAREKTATPVPESVAKPLSPSPTSLSTTDTKRKLSYKEKTTLENIVKQMPLLIKERDELNENLTNPSNTYDQIADMTARIGAIAILLEDMEMRWLELNE